jgi:hypothetical protein
MNLDLKRELIFWQGGCFCELLRDEESYRLLVHMPIAGESGAVIVVKLRDVPKGPSQEVKRWCRDTLASNQTFQDVQKGDTRRLRQRLDACELVGMS